MKYTQLIISFFFYSFVSCMCWAESGQGNAHIKNRTDNLDNLADYYAVLRDSDENMSMYLAQASSDPLAFRETVRKDLLERIYLGVDAGKLEETLLDNYVNIEILAMHFIKTGKSDLSERRFLRWWNDQRIVLDFKLVSSVMGVYRFSGHEDIAAAILLSRPRTLRTFKYARHHAFQKISNLYLIDVYGCFLRGDNNLALVGFVKHFAQLLDAMYFQGQGNVSEAIALVVKVMHTMTAESRNQYLRDIAQYIVAHCNREQQNFFTKACLQYDLIQFSESEE
ncbi:MAG: hypothetical protein HRU15_02290 [Planctomycetes bacterium]|nr:hypothetical protein [Planctomycetota bacterium]